MSDYCIDGGAVARSHSTNRLVEAMDQIMAPLFQRIAGRATAGRSGSAAAETDPVKSRTMESRHEVMRVPGWSPYASSEGLSRSGGTEL